MKSRMVAFICAAALLSGQSLGLAAQTSTGAMAILKEGGKIILMRHANAPSGQSSAVGLTSGCLLQDGRGLDAAGFYQARAIGAYLSREHVEIAAGYTSDVCRAWDTARLVAAGAPVLPSPALKSTDPIAVAEFREEVTQDVLAAPHKNILLVTHSNIVPRYSNYPTTSEIASGLVLVLDPADWTIASCLDFTAQASNEPAKTGVDCATEENR